jgi:hypothetical protein
MAFVSGIPQLVDMALCEGIGTVIYNSQFNETSVMHFYFNLLRIKGLYIFRALLGHPQE